MANDTDSPGVEFQISGRTVIVSPEDVDLFLAHTWHIDARGYVRRTYRVTAGHNGKRGHIQLHRVISGAAPGQFTDHRNRNRLDNRRDNLRLASPLENSRNVKSKNQKAGKFKGVRPAATGKWSATIGAGEKGPNGKARQLKLGTFDTAEQAARAYDAAARLHFGPYASCNFPAPEDLAWSSNKLREGEADFDTSDLPTPGGAL